MSSAPHAAWRNAQAGQNKDAAITAAIDDLADDFIGRGIENPPQLVHDQGKGAQSGGGLAFDGGDPVELACRFQVLD